ncbi:aldehyde dehydrogenase family protein [Colwellia psychrerythraea]|uniref:Aldehyde Dehydrogenase n=1 Tax=Colwellia psychrerythraea TaxID=28229 RepID=A0A099KZM1_COLPS|nr:aldehyde dehydrogenase family protein [Colwellia psychrerythraea]KGJ96184.1 Aldehyde Dehydrogenase [Colwellia psychrerythraea]
MSNIQTTRSPIDNSIYVERELASQTQIKQALKLANSAQAQWRTSSLQQRAACCHAMVDILLSKADEIAEQLCWMMGRPIRYGKGEVNGMADRARFMITEATNALKDIELADKPGFIRYIKREPLGVVFIIAPWNYPYLTAINSIIPAIMSGNSVLLKHSAQTPLCGEQFALAFAKAGLPAGIFQHLYLSHADTEKLIKQPVINYVAFTGSVAGGEMLERAASGRFIGVGLELGGKDAAYVRADANIAEAAVVCADGGFFNSGQSCCGIERIYVHSDIYEKFVSQVVALVNDYKLGRPDEVETTLGPLVKAENADFVRQQITQAIAAGAKAHIDRRDFPLDKPGSAYLAPQVLTKVDHSMSVMFDESFGPVVGIMKVSNDEEAVSLMNDSDFGLTAAVFTRNIKQGITLGEQLAVGTFFINRCDYLDPALPWGGVKNSGSGCTLSSLGYAALTRAKSFHIKLSKT